MTSQVNLGVGVVDNTQSGLSSAERNISKFSKKSIKQLELEAKVSFPSIAGQIDGLEKNFSALKRKLGKFQFSGMRVGKKGNILGDMLFDAREIRGNLSTDVTKGLLDNLKAIQKGLSTGSVKSNNILGIDTAKEIKKINELIAALETYNKQMKVIERAWGAQDTAKIQAEKRKAYSAEFEEARKQKKDDELFRRRWAHEFGQWNKKDAELARLQREADRRAKAARIQYDQKINSGTDTRTPELNDLRKFYQEQEKLANKAAKAEIEANKEIERQFKSRIKAKRNAADIEIAIDNEQTLRARAEYRHFRTQENPSVNNIEKEIKALKKLKDAEDELDRAQGKKARNKLHRSVTNERIRDLERELEAAKKTAAERAKAEKDATDAAKRQSKARRAWIKREKALVKKLGGLFLRAFSVHQIIHFGQKIAETTGYFEQQQIALEGILGSATKARSVLNDITNFALKSPFTTKDLVGFTKQLSAFGVGDDDLFPTVTKLADISAGLGVDMSRIILAYGQVKSASVLRGQELRQFTEAGIPMVDALSKKFTELNGELVTTADVFELISERKVSFEMVSEVLSDMTEEGGQFYKMQEELTNTLTGQISKLKDMWDIAMRDMGKSGNRILNGIVKLLQRMVKDALSFSVAIAAAFATPMLAKAIVHFKALSRLLRISFNSIKGIGASIYGLAAGALALAITKVIRSTTELKRAFEDIETSFRKETDKMIRGFDSLAKKISKAKVGTKEFADAVDTLSTNYGDFVSDEVITKLKAQDEISERLAKNFGETANNIREAIIELKKFQELEEKRETASDMFLREKTEGKVFRNWMRNNKLGMSDMTKDVFKSMYERDAINNRELLDIWDELYDDAVTLFATGEDLSKEEFERIFTETIKETFPEISEEELLRVVKLGWQATSQNTGTGFNNLYNDLVDSQNRITNSDYYKLQKTFEDWTKEYKDSEDFVEKQNNMEAAYFKAIRDSVVGKFGENDLTRALESAYGMQDGKVIATNFDNQSVNNILKVLEEFESTITDEKAKTWFSEAKKLFKEGVEDKSDRAAVVSDRMEAHEYLIDEVVSGLWRQYIPNNKTYKALREQIKSDYNEAKTELESYTGNDPKDKKRKDELSKRIKALETLASEAFYDVDLSDKTKGRDDKYNRILVTNFFDEFLSIIKKAEDATKKIVGVTGYTSALGDFVGSLKPDNFLRAFFEEGGNPFADMVKEMTEKYGIEDFIPEFNVDDLQTIFKQLSINGETILVPDYEAIYKKVTEVVGNQVIEGLRKERDKYQEGTSDYNRINSEISRFQEHQAQAVKEMEERWSIDEIATKIDAEIKALTDINNTLKTQDEKRKIFEDISSAIGYRTAQKLVYGEDSTYERYDPAKVAQENLLRLLNSSAGEGIKETTPGELLSALLSGSGVGLSGLSQLVDIKKDLQELVNQEFLRADLEGTADAKERAKQFQDVVEIFTKGIDEVAEKTKDAALKIIEASKTLDMEVGVKLGNLEREYKNSIETLNELAKTNPTIAKEKDQRTLELTQDYFNNVLTTLGGKAMPDWMKQMFGSGDKTGFSGFGKFLNGMSGNLSLEDMIKQGFADKFAKGKISAEDAAKGASDAAGAIALVDAIIKAIYEVLSFATKLGTQIIDWMEKTNDVTKTVVKKADGSTRTIRSAKDFDYTNDMYATYTEKYDSDKLARQKASLQAVQTFNQHIMDGWEKLKSGDVLGAVFETIASIGDLVVDIFGISDSAREQVIQGLLNDVQNLGKSIETIDFRSSFLSGWEAADELSKKITLLQQQQEAYEAAWDEENAKKSSDKAKLDEYQAGATDAFRAQLEHMKALKEEILGTADALADRLTDALVSSFKNGTNAARAWKDAVKSYIGEVLTQTIFTKMIAPQVQDAMNEWMYGFTDSYDKNGNLVTAEQKALERYGENFDNIAKQRLKDERLAKETNAILNDIGTTAIDIYEHLPAGVKDYISYNGAGSSMSGGISAITEDTARTLEGLGNSMLMQMILTNQELSTISQSGFAQVQVSWFNDMLYNTRLIADNTKEIKTMISDSMLGVKKVKVEMS